MKQKKKKRKKEIREEKELNERLINDRTIRDIRALFEQEEDYYKLKPKRINNFWNNNYIECESNGDKNIDSSLGEYLNKIKNLLEEYYYFSSKF